MKYIVLGLRQPDGKVDHEIPFAFPNNCVHKLVAAALLASEDLKQYEVIAAGEFSSMNMADLGCHGKSESLGNIKSRGEVDDRLFRTYDYFHGLA